MNRHPFLFRAVFSLCVLLLLPSLVARAQYVIVKGGGGVASHFGSVRHIESYKIGLAYEHETGGNWSLEAGLYYYGKGYREHDSRVPLLTAEGLPVLNEEGEARYGKKRRTVGEEYLSLPLLAHYYIQLRPLHYVQLSFGPYLAYGIGGKDKVKGDAQREGSERLYHERNTFSVQGTHRVDAGLQLGVGYQWNRRFTCGLETDLGLLSMRKEGGKNVSALLTLSYRWRTN